VTEATSADTTNAQRDRFWSSKEALVFDQKSGERSVIAERQFLTSICNAVSLGSLRSQGLRSELGVIRTQLPGNAALFFEYGSLRQTQLETEGPAMLSTIELLAIYY